MLKGEIDRFESTLLSGFLVGDLELIYGRQGKIHSYVF